MRALAAALAALTVGGCAGAVAAPETYDLETRRPGAELAFVRGTAGWRLSTVPPRYPYNSETTPRFDGLSGAGSDAPFGCGLEVVKRGYLSVVRGRLICAMGQADGVLQLRPIGRGDYTRVYDATAVSGPMTVIANQYGQRQVAVMTLDARGDIALIRRLPEGVRPDQAAVLPSGRVAVLHTDAGSCVWSVFAFEDGGVRETSRTEADHRYQCQSALSGGRLIRDQVTGQAYVRMKHPAPNMLYRIHDNGTGSPATLVTDDFTAGMTGEPRLETALNGALYFTLATNSGPLAGRYDPASNRTETVDLTSPTGRWQDTARLTGFMVGEEAGDPPRMTLLQRSGETTLVSMRISD